MTINELKSLLIVFECRSFSIAAKKLCVSQSAISKRIRHLEHELQVKLFEVRGNMVFATLEGRRLIPYAQQLLITLNNAMAHLTEPTLSAIPIYLGSTLYPLYWFVPNFIGFLNQQGIDHHTLFIKHIHKHEIDNAIGQGLVDLALSTAPVKLKNSLKCVSIYEETIYLGVSRHHPLTQCSDLRLSNVMKYPCIAMQPGHFIRDKLDQWCLKKNIELPIQYEINSFFAIKQCLKATSSWSMLPDRLFDDDIVRLACVDFSEKITLSWYCHEARFESPLIQYIGDLFVRSLAHYCI